MALSLLLADDKPAIAKIISLSLPREEFAVEAVTTGRDALARIESSPPNFLLIDVSLPYKQDGSHPEKDGLFLTRHIKTHPALKQVKIILLTNAFEPVDEKKCREFLADGVLIKPFEPSELRARLKSLMTPDMKLELEAGRGGGSGARNSGNELPDFTPISLDVGLSAEPTQKKSPGKSTELPESLSPAAKELSEFFSQEIATNTQVGLKSVKTADGIRGTDGVIELEVPDFKRAAEEWKPRQPSAPADLSQWKSRETKATDLFEAPDARYDTGGSNFEFSRDYLERLGTRTPRPGHERTSSDLTPVGFMPLPGLEQMPATHRSPPAHSHSVPASSPGSAAPAAAGPAITAAQVEAIVREETRKVCQDVVDKVAWEVIPELAENIIRRELEKVLASLDQEKDAGA